MLFFIWLSKNLMLLVPLYPIFEMQDIYLCIECFLFWTQTLLIIFLIFLKCMPFNFSYNFFLHFRCVHILFWKNMFLLQLYTICLILYFSALGYLSLLWNFLYIKSTGYLFSSRFIFHLHDIWFILNLILFWSCRLFTFSI